MKAMTDEFKKNIKDYVEIILSMPFAGKLNGESWEYLVSYAYNVPHVPTKLLYDVVDLKNLIGRSVKTIRGNVVLGGRVEPIIARADIYSKAQELGYDELSDKDHPQYLGNALIRFWNDKIQSHADLLGIKTKKISMLVKSFELTEFAYFEKDLESYEEDNFTWRWTNEQRVGLLGFPKDKDYWKFKWNPKYKQLFERWLIPRDAYIFEVAPRHLSMSALKEALEI
jgi:hypothetical protein